MESYCLVTLMTSKRVRAGLSASAELLVIYVTNMLDIVGVFNAALWSFVCLVIDYLLYCQFLGDITALLSDL